MSVSFPLLVSTHYKLIALMQNIFSLGETIYFVGGCIRDLLMKQDISKADIDLSCSMPPKVLQEFLQSKNIKVIPIGSEHGTLGFVLEDNFYEVTSFRKDIQTDGRHARVTFTKNITEDAQRRDFTINALYMDPWGKLLTPIPESLPHIRQKQISFIGNPVQRIHEDYLRILRYYRFVSLYGIPKDFEAISEIFASHKDKIIVPSSERIKQEIYKIMLGDHAIECLFMMQKYGMDSVFLKTGFTLDLYQEKLEKAKEYSLFVPPHIKIFLLCETLPDLPWTRAEKRDFLLIKDIVKRLTEQEDKIERLCLRHDYQKKENIFCLAVILAFSQETFVVDFLMTTKLPALPFTHKNIMQEGFQGKDIKEEYQKRRYSFLKDYFQ